MKPYQDARVEGKKTGQAVCRIGKADQVDFYNGSRGAIKVFWDIIKTEGHCRTGYKNDHKIYVYQLDKGISQEQRR